ncbi:MAG: hypothetical protein U1F11_04910 [Steroidobacteraceae bacterium]
MISTAASARPGADDARRRRRAAAGGPIAAGAAARPGDALPLLIAAFFIASVVLRALLSRALGALADG